MLKILTESTKSLHERSTEIDRDFLLKKETQELIKEMIITMYEDDGIGLAAPQIGKNIRICVIGKEAFDGQVDMVLVNPIWEKTSRRKATDVEGCLSVPNIFGKVKRWKNTSVSALDKNGEPINFSASDFFSRVIQHEVDHLDGILFIEKAKGLYKSEETKKPSIAV